MAFTKKRIDVSFSYASKSVGILPLSGLRVSLAVANVGVTGVAQLEMAIFGLSLSHMNALTLTGREAGTYGNNTVTVTAGEEGVSLATVFTGTVRRAVADAKGMPEVALRVSGMTSNIYAIKPAQPTSVRGSADVAQIAQQLAGQMGLTLENNGVQTKLSNPYLDGTLMTQTKSLAQHAGMAWTIDPDQQTLAIWPRGSSRAGVVPVSRATGMVGYPSYTASGIEVQTYYNPEIRIGVQLDVQSDFTPACGMWSVSSCSHLLEAEMPKGKWFTYAEASTITGEAVNLET